MGNIKTNKLIKRTLYTLGLFCISLLLVMSINRKSEGIVRGHIVHIKPIKGDRNLITQEEVDVIYKKYLGFNILEANIKDLNLRELEERIKSDKRVKKVEVFVDADDNINTWIIQRQPIIRIVDTKDFSYYLDEEGNDIPTKRGLAVRVPIATGYIDLYRKELILDEKETSLKNVYECAQYIMNDGFLSQFIEQIYVNSDRDIELIPKIGKQYIIIGDATNLDKKFNKIKTFYKDGMPTVGWSKYKAINLKYDDDDKNKGLIYGIM